MLISIDTQHLAYILVYKVYIMRGNNQIWKKLEDEKIHSLKMKM